MDKSLKNLRLLWGSVNAEGKLVQAGSNGWSVERLGEGSYQVRFKVSLSNIPAVILTCVDDTNNKIAASRISSSGFVVTSRDADIDDCGFSFFVLSNELVPNDPGDDADAVQNVHDSVKNLALAWGSATDSGQPRDGGSSDWSVSSPNTGSYKIGFNSELATVPSVLMTCLDDTNNTIAASQVTTNEFAVTTRQGSNAENSAFAFAAIAEGGHSSSSLKLVWGAVTEFGDIEIGGSRQWSVDREARGSYEVTFDTNLGSVPLVFLTCRDDTDNTIAASQVDSRKFFVTSRRRGSEAEDSGFSFVCLYQ